jgi:hypothetical protein
VYRPPMDAGGCCVAGQAAANLTWLDVSHNRLRSLKGLQELKALVSKSSRRLFDRVPFATPPRAACQANETSCSPSSAQRQPQPDRAHL